MVARPSNREKFPTVMPVSKASASVSPGSPIEIGSGTSRMALPNRSTRLLVLEPAKVAPSERPAVMAIWLCTSAALMASRTRRAMM